MSCFEKFYRPKLYLETAQKLPNDHLADNVSKTKFSNQGYREDSTEEAYFGEIGPFPQKSGPFLSYTSWKGLIISAHFPDILAKKESIPPPRYGPGN